MSRKTIIVCTDINTCGNQATFYCQEEELYYCQKCSHQRHLLPKLQHHHVSEIEQPCRRALCDLCSHSLATFTCAKCGPLDLCHHCNLEQHTNPHRKHHIVLPHNEKPSQIPESEKTTKTAENGESAGSTKYYLKAVFEDKKIRKDNKPSSARSDMLSQMKDRLVKILNLTKNPGTVAEGEQAKAVMESLMTKYQLSLSDLVKDENKGLTGERYYVFIQSQNSSTRYTLPKWSHKLAREICSFYPSLVTYGFDLQKHKYCFFGFEECALSASQLFTKLFNMIGHYREEHKAAKHPGLVALESYAIGLVEGLQLSKKLISDNKNREIILVENAGMLLLEKMKTRYKVTTTKLPKRKFDRAAYRLGYKKGKTLNVTMEQITA